MHFPRAESASKQAAKASDEVRKMEDTHNFKPEEDEWKKGAPAGTQTPAIQTPQPPQTPVRAGGPTGGPLTKGLEAEDKGAKSVAKETAFGKPEMAGTIGSPSGEGAKKASGTVSDDAAGKAGLAGAAGVAGAGGGSPVVHKVTLTEELGVLQRELLLEELEFTLTENGFLSAFAT